MDDDGNDEAIRIPFAVLTHARCGTEVELARGRGRCDACHGTLVFRGEPCKACGGRGVRRDISDDLLWCDTCGELVERWDCNPPEIG